jgi:nucleotide-binding universal stress UspA family protein
LPADLIVLGTRRLDRVDRFLLGVSIAVVQRAPCSVLIARSPSSGR